MSELPGQSGHALPVQLWQFRANSDFTHRSKQQHHCMAHVAVYPQRLPPNVSFSRFRRESGKTVADQAGSGISLLFGAAIQEA